MAHFIPASLEPTKNSWSFIRNLFLKSYAAEHIGPKERPEADIGGQIGHFKFLSKCCYINGWFSAK